MEKQDHIDRVLAQWKSQGLKLDLGPVGIIGRAGRIMEYVDRALESKFEQYGISRGTFDVLAALKRNGPPYRLSQRDLMRSLLRTSGSMSLRIDTLEREGLVSRVKDRDDRRSVFVTLSTKGSNLLDKIIPEHLANEGSLIAVFTTSEKEQLTALLRKWLITLESNASNGPLQHLGMVLLHPHTSLTKRRAVGLPDIPGFLVHAVEAGSWADETGFRKGDLICRIEGRAVDSLAELRRVLNVPRPRIKRFSIRRGIEAIEL
ncbi:MAG TPA: MarR family transcriptional regulator [Bryobacteraceae bacterium]|jgi:DNA-binding MarR family transcriptional regulator|nr:MarR family transcriptional regulator [Bryobacteraceae bacterium]